MFGALKIKKIENQKERVYMHADIHIAGLAFPVIYVLEKNAKEKKLILREIRGNPEHPITRNVARTYMQEVKPESVRQIEEYARKNGVDIWV